jgi:hypothetical protein
LGLALVAGKKRLPMPATGNTAFLIFFMASARMIPLEKIARHIAAAILKWCWSYYKFSIKPSRTSKQLLLADGKS